MNGAARVGCVRITHRCGRAKADGGGIFGRRPCVHPLPKGEGRGEGEATTETPMRLRTADGFNYVPSMAPPRLTRVARILRKQDTWAEKLLWSWLRDRRFSSYKFRRQHPFGPHVLDFFCLEAWLNLELDGFQHGTPEQQAKDVERDALLAARAIKVLRFWNSRLRREKEAIRDTI